MPAFRRSPLSSHPYRFKSHIAPHPCFLCQRQRRPQAHTGAAPMPTPHAPAGRRRRPAATRAHRRPWLPRKHARGEGRGEKKEEEDTAQILGSPHTMHLLANHCVSVVERAQQIMCSPLAGELFILGVSFSFCWAADTPSYSSYSFFPRQDKDRFSWARRLQSSIVLHGRSWPVSAARAPHQNLMFLMCPIPYLLCPTPRLRTSVTPTPMYSADSPSPPLENNFLGSGAYPFDRERGAPPGAGTAHANRTGSASSIGSRSSNASAPFRCGYGSPGA